MRALPPPGYLGRAPLQLLVGRWRKIPITLDEEGMQPRRSGRMRGSKQTQQDLAVGVSSDLRGRLLRRIRNGTDIV